MFRAKKTLYCGPDKESHTSTGNNTVHFVYSVIKPKLLNVVTKVKLIFDQLCLINYVFIS